MSASGACEVIPGESIATGQTYADGDMRLIAKPTVYVLDGQIGSDQMDPTLLSSLGAGGQAANYFLNPNFGDPFWEIGTGLPSGYACPAGTATVLANDWFVQPAGAAVTQEQSTTVPNVNSLFSLLVTGASGATTVGIGQNLPRDVAAFLQQNFTVSFQIYNGTGAAIVAQVNCATATAVNNFASVNSQLTTAGPSCPAAAWTPCSVTFDGSAFTGMENGLQITIQIPSGALGNSDQSVNLSQMQLQLGSAATAFAPPYDLLVTEPENNLFVNGNLDESLWGVSSGSCPASVNTELVKGWFCQPAGASATLARSSSTPNEASTSSASITGSSGTGAVLFGQNISRDCAGQLQQDLTFSGWLYNGTGGAFVPQLNISTPATANGFGSVTLENQIALASCAAGEWTQLQATFSGGVANIGNGLQAAVSIPSLDTSSVKLAQLQLVLGDVATPFQVTRSLPPAPAVAGQTGGLSIANASDTTLTIGVASAVLGNAGGFTMLAAALSGQTLDAGTNGLNGLDTGALADSTCYAVYLIATAPGGATGTLLSASFAGPAAMPAGYNYWALAGSAATDGSGNFLNFRQSGRRTWLQPVNVLDGEIASGWTAQGLGACVPPIAQSVSGQCGTTGGVDAQVSLAGNASGLGQCIVAIQNAGTGEGTNIAEPAYDTEHAMQVGAQFEVPVTAAGGVATLYANTAYNSRSFIINITGYEI